MPIFTAMTRNHGSGQKSRYTAKIMVIMAIVNSWFSYSPSDGMVAWLCVWAKVQICIWPSRWHCHSLSLALVNPDWFFLPGFTFLVLADLGSPRQNWGGP